MPKQAPDLVRWSRARATWRPLQIYRNVSLGEVAGHRFWPAQLVVWRLIVPGFVVYLNTSGAVGRSTAACRNACTCRVLEACFLRWVRIGIASMQEVEIGVCLEQETSVLV